MILQPYREKKYIKYPKSLLQPRPSSLSLSLAPSGVPESYFDPVSLKQRVTNKRLETDCHCRNAIANQDWISTPALPLLRFYTHTHTHTRQKGEGVVGVESPASLISTSHSNTATTPTPSIGYSGGEITKSTPLIKIIHLGITKYFFIFLLGYLSFHCVLVSFFPNKILHYKEILLFIYKQ